MPGIGRAGRIALDVALILGLIFTCWRIVSPAREVGSRAESVRARPYLELGQTLGLQPNVFADAERTAVVMLDTACTACEASTPFYRKLASLASQTPGARVVVVTDGSRQDATEWLARHEIRGAHVLRVSSRARLGFMLTPTLVILNSAGVITDLVEQQLSEDSERQVLARLAGKQPQAIRIAQSLREVFVSDTPAFHLADGDQIVDPRDRSSFGIRHSGLATNIPDDELSARGPAELAMTRTVYLDCQYTDQQQCRAAGFALSQTGFKDIVLVLR